MNIHPLKTKRRKMQRLEKLGSEHPFCLYCGCSEPMQLRPVTRPFLEQHHLLGLANDPELTLALCFNCHALATEGLLQAGVTMTREPDPIKFAANMFQAFAVHHKMLSEASRRAASVLSRADDNSMTILQDRGPAHIVIFILRRAWPIWKVHRGKVPDSALRQLERDGDWPRGCAKAAMQQISRDAELRQKLEQWCR
jgi:hypothetical protein